MAYLVNGYLSANYTPLTQPKDEQKRGCCAACRRGVPGYGVLPCGKLGSCKCHQPAAEQARAFLATREQINRDEKGES